MCFSCMFWAGYVKPGLEASQEKLGIMFFFFFNVDTFGIDFHVISGLFLEFRAHESVEFRNLAHQVQRNANFGSRSNCVIC